MDHCDAPGHTSRDSVLHINVNVLLLGPEKLFLRDVRATCGTFGTFAQCVVSSFEVLCIKRPPFYSFPWPSVHFSISTKLLEQPS